MIYSQNLALTIEKSSKLILRYSVLKGYNKKISTMEGDNKCWTPGCGKKATMLCPVCKQMDLEPSFFCSQDCFKKNWGLHKLVHIPREEQQKKRN